MRKLRFAAALLILGSLGGLLYLGSLVAKYAVPRAEAQTAVNACVSGTCRASRIALPTNGKLCTSSGCSDYIQNTGSTTLIQDSSGVTISAGLTVNGANSYVFGMRSDVANGVNGFSLNTDGARVDFGTGSIDYLYSNGTRIVALAGFETSGSAYALIDSAGLKFLGEDTAANDNMTVDSQVALTTGRLLVLKNNGTEKASIASDGAITTSSTKTKGTITLAAGTGTATVISGAVCVCSDTTAVNAVQCSVSGTTLTANGTGTDVIAYICL